MRQAILLLAGLLFAASPIGGAEAMKIAVSPSQSFAPANLRIRVTIEPNAQNRRVAVAAESGDFYRSSEMEIEGDQGPRTVFFEFKGVPSGAYQIRGVVGDARGREVASAQQNVFVFEGANER